MKLFKKLAIAVVGAVMALGVGIGINAGAKGVPVSAETAKSEGTFTNSAYQSGVWTAYDGNKGSNYYRMDSGAYIKNTTAFTDIDASQKIDITINMRTVGGADYKTIGVKLYSDANCSSAISNEITINATSGTTLANATGSISLTSASYKGNVFFKFYPTKSASDKGPGIAKITVSYTASAGKTATGITLYGGVSADEIIDGSTVSFDASSSSDYTLVGEVAYESGDPDGNYKVETTATAGVSVGNVNEGLCTLNFTSNGNYEFSVSAISTPSIKISFAIKVSGLVAIEYEKYTSAIVEGDYVFMSDDASYTYVMGDSISGSRVVNGTAPTVSADKIINPSSSYVWHIAAHGDYWTIQNISNDKYLVATGTKNQADLSDSITEYADWAISYSSSKWVIENVERRTASTDSNNRYLRNNGDVGWAAYSSTQSNGPALFKKVTNDPYIIVEADSSTELSVGGTVILNATLTNTSGTVTWTIKDSSDVITKADNGNSTTITGVKDGSAYVVASFDGCDDVETKITVKKQLASIEVTTPPNKVSYQEGETFDPSGMVITATYDDGSTKTNITSSTAGLTWSPKSTLSTVNTSISITYEEEGYGSASTTQDITVTGRIVSKIEVTKMPNKTVYSKGQTLDTTGIIVTATYTDTTTANVTSSCEYSPTLLNTVGTQTITVTFGEKTTTFDVTVNDITGPIANGRYFISDSNGNTLKGGKFTNKEGADIVAKEDSVAWNFTLVADNTYLINQDGNYLYSLNNNDGMRTTTETTYTWVIASNGDGTYAMQTNDGTQDRFLSCYNLTDFRAYKDTSATNADYAICLVEEKEMFADNFLNSFTAGCIATGSYNNESMDWTKAAAQFATLSTENQNVFKNATYSVSGSGSSTVVTPGEGVEDYAANVVARYDLIVGKYSAFNDFMNRGTGASASRVTVVDSSATMMAAIISFIGVSTIAGYFFLRKKKQTF